MTLRTRLSLLAMTVALGTSLPTSTLAYVVSGPTWPTSLVPYFVNTTNMDLPAASVEAAVRAGADTWRLQSGASLSFLFSGPSSLTAVTNDGVNLVVFRNEVNGANASAIATTYWWSTGNRILDADIIFWDGAFQFFAGSAGCSNGVYIEDIAAHEFGHALGLLHSTSPFATMYSSISWCNTTNRILDADDIAGVRALYPPGQQPLPQAPGGVRIAG